MKLNRRQLIGTGAAAGTALALAGGGAWFLLRDDTPKGASDRVDLLTGVIAIEPPYTPDDLQQFAMLSLTGGMPKKMGMTLRFYDLDGTPNTAIEPSQVSLLNLVTGEQVDAVSIAANDDGSWTLEQDDVRSEGWWQIRAETAEGYALFTFLVPDPNLTGFETPPTIESDPYARSMLVASLDHLSNRTSLRWWEWLSGGNGAIILADFGVTTTASNSLPDAFENNSLMAGRIPPPGEGEVSFRQENPRTVTVGTEGSRRINEGTPEPYSASRFLPISEYGSTYDGHDGERLGMVADIGGRSCQLISFHLPGHTEAWFAFWIDVETLQLRELFMLSVNHYMHWVYYDVDEPFELDLGL